MELNKIIKQISVSTFSGRYKDTTIDSLLVLYNKKQFYFSLNLF